jgi:hypothetical protein
MCMCTCVRAREWHSSGTFKRVSIHKKLVLQGKGISEEGGDRPQASERARQRLFSFSVCQVCGGVRGCGCLRERARCCEGARRFFFFCLSRWSSS